MNRLVIKVGTSSLAAAGSLKRDFIVELIRQISILRENGTEVCLVTSGAISAGVVKLGLKKRPSSITKKQACAAIGQAELMHVYDELFDIYGLRCAQILVSHEDFSIKERFSHLSNTFGELFAYGAIPIVNENDALAVDEIRVGDNDTLSAFTAKAIGADKLVIITDVDGLYDRAPTCEGAKLISVVDEITDEIYAYAGASASDCGTGGMVTKLNAAKIAAESGVETLILSNSKVGRLSETHNYSSLGTLFKVCR